MIGIITDSTCDIPGALLEKCGIIAVPNTVTWGNHQFRDPVDLRLGRVRRRVRCLTAGINQSDCYR